MTVPIGTSSQSTEQSFKRTPLTARASGVRTYFLYAVVTNRFASRNDDDALAISILAYYSDSYSDTLEEVSVVVNSVSGITNDLSDRGLAISDLVPYTGDVVISASIPTPVTGTPVWGVNENPDPPIGIEITREASRTDDGWGWKGVVYITNFDDDLYMDPYFTDSSFSGSIQAAENVKPRSSLVNFSVALKKDGVVNASLNFGLTYLNRLYYYLGYRGDTEVKGVVLTRTDGMKAIHYTKSQKEEGLNGLTQPDSVTVMTDGSGNYISITTSRKKLTGEAVQKTSFYGLSTKILRGAVGTMIEKLWSQLNPFGAHSHLLWDPDYVMNLSPLFTSAGSSINIDLARNFPKTQEYGFLPGEICSGNFCAASLEPYGWFEVPTAPSPSSPASVFTASDAAANTAFGGAVADAENAARLHCLLGITHNGIFAIGTRVTYEEGLP